MVKGLPLQVGAARHQDVGRLHVSEGVCSISQFRTSTFLSIKKTCGRCPSHVRSRALSRSANFIAFRIETPFLKEEIIWFPHLSQQLDNGKELGGEVHVEVAAGQEHLEITLKKEKRKENRWNPTYNSVPRIKGGEKIKMLTAKLRQFNTTFGSLQQNQKKEQQEQQLPPPDQ